MNVHPPGLTFVPKTAKTPQALTLAAAGQDMPSTVMDTTALVKMANRSGLYNIIRCWKIIASPVQFEGPNGSVKQISYYALTFLPSFYKCHRKCISTFHTHFLVHPLSPLFVHLKSALKSKGSENV